jgi:hypothetical protein
MQGAFAWRTTCIPGLVGAGAGAPSGEVASQGGELALGNRKGH